ncbi:MAG: phosphatidylglycerophosphatase A [Pseudomonadota bacterium]
MSALPYRIATLGGIGLLPSAPGTWASIATVPLTWGLHALGGFWLVAAVTVGFAILGWWSIARLDGPDQDPPEVVIDELVGMMLALWPLSLGLTLIEAGPAVFPWPGWLMGFLLFRFFDIVKPPPVNWAERLPGATGVMLDDIVAGVLTAAIALIAAALSHGWFVPTAPAPMGG